MNDVQIGQKYDTLHVDVFDSVGQKSNNEKITLLNHTDFTLFLDDNN